MKKYWVLILLFCLLGTVGNLMAQQVSQIKLVDKLSGDPVAYAHILVEDLKAGSRISKGYLTDEKGNASIETNTIVRISITFVGYDPS